MEIKAMINFNKEYKDFFNHSKVFEQLIYDKLGNDSMYEKALESIGEESLKVIIISSLEIMLIYKDSLTERLYIDASLFYLIDEEVNSPDIFSMKDDYLNDKDKSFLVNEIKKITNLYFSRKHLTLLDLDKEIKDWPETQKIIDLANKLNDDLPIKLDRKKNKI